MESKSTPLPWTFGVYVASKDFKKIKQHSCICDPETKALIAVTGPAECRNSQLDSELIVKAVNNHDKLITQLEASQTMLLKYKEECGDCDHSVNICICDIIDLIEDNDALLSFIKENSLK